MAASEHLPSRSEVNLIAFSDVLGHFRGFFVWRGYVGIHHVVLFDKSKVAIK